MEKTRSSKGNIRTISSAPLFKGRYSGQHVSIGFNIPPATSDVINKLQIVTARSEIASARLQAAASRSSK
jgi:hypothetical protein